MHAAMQCLEDSDVFDGELRPLAQMRSANKKARNIGDVEVSAAGDVILEAWDAKYGQPYLRDELDELAEKLAGHVNLERVGFVVDTQPDLPADVAARRDDVADEFGVDLLILSWDEWLDMQVARSPLGGQDFGECWLLSYAESLCLTRRDRAPIDEPADQWVADLGAIVRSRIG
jgi:hypothetical protein